MPARRPDRFLSAAGAGPRQCSTDPPPHSPRRAPAARGAARSHPDPPRNSSAPARRHGTSSSLLRRRDLLPRGAPGRRPGSSGAGIPVARVTANASFHVVAPELQRHETTWPARRYTQSERVVVVITPPLRFPSEARVEGNSDGPSHAHRICRADSPTWCSAQSACHGSRLRATWGAPSGRPSGATRGATLRRMDVQSRH